jgi:hypothetical protein
MYDGADIQQLVDERAIRDVISRYSRALDRHDYDLLASLFHPDAIDEHGHYNGSASGFVEWMRAGAQPGTYWSHHLGNQIIDFTSASVAEVETYCLALCRRPPTGKLALLSRSRGEGHQEILLRVRYLDRMERRNDVWRIAHRRVVYAPCMLIDCADEFPLTPEMLRDGDRKSDPVYCWDDRRSEG